MNRQSTEVQRHNTALPHTTESLVDNINIEMSYHESLNFHAIHRKNIDIRAEALYPIKSENTIMKIHFLIFIHIL